MLVVVVVAGVAWRIFGGGGNGGSTESTPVSTEVPRPPLRISILAALPVEPWAASAAESFNAEGRSVGGQTIVVEVIPIDGLTARDKWAAGSFDPFPTAWLAESRAWVDQANIAALQRTGQDIFLAGGQYRAQPVVLSPLVWGIWPEAYDTLQQYFNGRQVSWDEIQEASGLTWEELGGLPEPGQLKLIVSGPDRDPAGLTAMVGAAGEFFDKPSINSDNLEDAEFLAWLEDLLDTVVSFDPLAAENMILFGRSTGDAGHMVENFLLSNMDGIVQRWGQPLTIVYPDPIAWFDFPYAISMGKETSADEKQAALDFKEFLLSADQQAAALEFGLRPACPECPSSGGLIEKWRGIGVAQNIQASRMRPASRTGLDFLVNWFKENFK